MERKKYEGNYFPHIWQTIKILKSYKNNDGSNWNWEENVMSIQNLNGWKYMTLRTINQLNLFYFAFIEIIQIETSILLYLFLENIFIKHK